MKKRITALFVAILFCFLFLTGCSSNDKPTCLERVGYDGLGIPYGVYYDLETKVMYIISYHGGVSPLYNADGSLKLYQEDGV